MPVFALGGWDLSSWDQWCRHSLSMWWTPTKNPGQQDSGELLWLAAICIYYHKSLLGELNAFLFNTTGREHLEVWVFFLWTLPHAPFPLADFSLYTFAAINCNLDYNKNKQKGKALATLHPGHFSGLCSQQATLRERWCVSRSKSSLLTPITIQQQIPQAHCSSPICNSLCT